MTVAAVTIIITAMCQPETITDDAVIMMTAGLRLGSRVAAVTVTVTVTAAARRLYSVTVVALALSRYCTLLVTRLSCRLQFPPNRGSSCRPAGPAAAGGRC